MKIKKIISGLLATIVMATAFVGCSNKNQNNYTSDSSSENSTSSTAAESSSELSVESPTELPTQNSPINIAVMKGPTGMGMVSLMSKAEAKESLFEYNFTLESTADAIVGKIAKGEIDAAAVPANLASVLYNKTNGGITVAAINTLGVLYVVESGDTIKSVADLKGKTIYSTGKGTTPEFALNYILTENGIDPTKDVTIEYKSEATEVAAIMGQDKSAIAVLPQPFVTISQSKNPDLREALSLSDEWDKLQKDGNKSSMVTGVLIVRNEFLEENRELFKEVLNEYKDSVEFINNDVDAGAKLVAKYEIAPEPVAKKAIPKCNITFMVNDEMKEKLSGYLEVLFNQNPASVGGKLPNDDFYFSSEAK
ncbi:MAG: ABC transporter substrate-binding protein [Oscillospiraceae bacterium]